MLFNSQIFLLLFLPVVVGAVWFCAGRLPSGHWAFRAFLLAASFFFYGYWDLRLLPLLVSSIIINYILIEIIRQQGVSARFSLFAGVTLNLAVLGFFKYFNFFAETISSISGADFDRFNIVLPLAISFFTFQQISALVDASRGTLRPHSALDYALFVAFFPQLIAGPIVRHDQLVPQLQSFPTREGIESKFSAGLILLTAGLVKKVFIADGLAEVADPIYAASLTSAVSTIDAWVAVFAFGFQIYFDFSGYSDMAIGIALLLGVSLPVNFRSPYRASSLIDFWRRWHITLSSFLRDYLYIALGGNRHGRSRQLLALMTTMLLGGLWHGAGWTFVLWGGLHGLGLCINHAWRSANLPMPTILGWAITFVFVMIAFLIFRAETFGSAQSLLLSLSGWHGLSEQILTQFKTEVMVLFGAAALAAVLLKEPHEFAEMRVLRKPALAIVFGLVLAFVIIHLGGVREQEFIYFQF